MAVELLTLKKDYYCLTGFSSYCVYTDELSYVAVVLPKLLLRLYCVCLAIKRLLTLRFFQVTDCCIQLCRKSGIHHGFLIGMAADSDGEPKGGFATRVACSARRLGMFLPHNVPGFN